MPKRKAFSKGGKGGGAKGKNGVKGKRKKSKHAVDWYTEDDNLGLFGGLAKKQKAKNERQRGPADDEDAIYEATSRVKNSRGKPAEEEDGPAYQDDLMDEDSEFEHSSDDEQEGAGTQAMSALLSSLQSSTGLLGARERSVLERVRNEQEGIEMDSDFDEGSDDASSEAGEDGGNESGQSAAEESDQEPEDDRDDATAAGMVQEAELLGSESGHFARHFVECYGMTEEELEASASNAPVERVRSKVAIGGRKFIVNNIGRTVPVGSGDKFVAARVDLEATQRVVDELEVKERVAKRWLEYAQRRDKLARRRIGPSDVIPARNELGMTELQASLFSAIKSYADVQFSARSLENASELRELYVLHALNHAFKAYDNVTRHNSRIAAKKRAKVKAADNAAVAKATGTLAEQRRATNGEDEEEEEEDTYRDQGFTRPRVLIMVPNRLAALRIVRLIIELLPDKATVGNSSRFWQEFSEAEEDGPAKHDVEARIKREKSSASESFDETYYAAKQHPVQTGTATTKGKGNRPEDWLDQFTGNTDENFRMGISVVGRKAIRLFSGFYNSDIILASPVGLRMATGQEVGDGVNGDDEDEEDSIDGDAYDEDAALAEFGVNTKSEERQSRRRGQKEDTDFLTSIELCVIDQADVFEMQNWQHVVDIMGAVNRKPLDIRDEMDFGRIRNYFLVDGLARRFRQTLVFSQYTSPFANALSVPANSSRLNMAGFVSLRPAQYEGALTDVAVPGIAHKFVRVDEGEDADEDADPRLRYFERNVMKALRRPEAAHTCVVVPSYLDFVSVRNLFRKAAAARGEIGLRAKGHPHKGMARRRGPDGNRANKREPDQALFVCISEYTDFTEVRRARSDFFVGRARVLLLTERFYFYNRFRIRGIHRLVFYAPPQHANYYVELCNLTEVDRAAKGQARDDGAGAAAGGLSNLVLFSALDAGALERLVGTSNAKHMLSARQTVFSVADSSR